MSITTSCDTSWSTVAAHHSMQLRQVLRSYLLLSRNTLRRTHMALGRRASVVGVRTHDENLFIHRLDVAVLHIGRWESRTIEVRGTEFALHQLSK